ncbi:MAG: septum formation initiator family protein [Eubacteriales bacterium]|nr:septum formation initiator family protein [Eubacteriales bacterium]
MTRAIARPQPQHSLPRHRARQLGGHNLLIRIISGLIVVLAFAWAISIYFKQETQFNRIAIRREELIKQESIANQRKQEQINLQNDINSTAYIEYVARNQLGMVKPNEIIFEDP